jgi:hypothetical protein
MKPIAMSTHPKPQGYYLTPLKKATYSLIMFLIFTPLFPRDYAYNEDLEIDPLPFALRTGQRYTCLKPFRGLGIRKMMKAEW